MELEIARCYNVSPATISRLGASAMRDMTTTPPGYKAIKSRFLFFGRIPLAMMLSLPLAAHGQPTHQDRLKPPSCTDATVLADMRRILAHAYEPYHIEVLDILHTEDGKYEGDQVCTGLVMTTKGPVRIIFFGQRVEDKVYGRVMTVQ